MTSQLNIDELYNSAKRKELKKYETFDKILLRCHTRIKLYAENRKTECLYQIPQFIIGVPLYNVSELQEYIVRALKNNGLLVKEYTHNWIFISWNKEKKEVRKKPKKETGGYRFIEDYNPSGKFIHNNKAMNDLKEKSIKMLNL
jgi:hypothetical protein